VQAVKVTNGFFLIGLSAVETDRERNIQLLKERAWFDIPVVYTNNRRAILALEKGNPGERAFEEAFTAWEQTSADLAPPPGASSAVLAPSPSVANPNPPPPPPPPPMAAAMSYISPRRRAMPKPRPRTVSCKRNIRICSTASSLPFGAPISAPRASSTAP
jgi:hypothetical protein